MSRTAGATLLIAGCVALSLTGCGFRAVRDEPVTLDDVRAAVVLSNGAERAAADGAHLAKGDRVRTQAGGTATLVVRGRRVVLGGGTDVTVPDGATVDLTTGALLVDRRRGPGLTVHAGDTTVDEIDEGAVRVERGFSVLVAGLSAGARLRTATGTRLDLPRLYQAGAAGRALPAAGTPLQLRHDAWERSVVPNLLADDDRLNGLAAEYDGKDAPVIPAAFRPGKGARASDLLLAAAIGRAAGDESAAAKARALRDAGGSWGVVAAIVETSVLDVGTALVAVLRGDAAVPTPASGAPSRTPDPGVVAGPTPEPTLGGGTRTPEPTRTTSKPTKPPTQTPTTASPSSESILDQIGKIIPSPLASVGDGLLGTG